MIVQSMGRMVLHSIFRRRRMIIGMSSGVLGTILIGSLLLSPVYEATSSVLIEGRNFQDLLFPEPQSGRQWTVFSNPKEVINTEIEIIRSRPVAERVVRSVGLHLPGTVEGVDTGLSGMARRSLRSVKQFFSAIFGAAGLKREPPTDELFERTVESLRKDLRIEPSTESHIVRITYRSISPSIATRVVNRVAEEYLNQHLAINSNQYESSFYAEQTAILENELTTLQEQLTKIMSEEGIASFSEQSTALLKKYQTFDTARTGLQKEILALKAKLGGIKEVRKKKDSMLIPLPEIAKDQIVQDLENNLVSLRFQLKSVGQRYTETTPQITNLREQIGQLESQIRSQVDQFINREEMELSRLQSEEQAIAQMMEGLEKQIKRLPEIEMTITRLQKQMQDKTSALTQLRNKYQDSLIGQAADLRIESVKIVSQASVPLKPVAPNILVNSILGLILAVVLSFSLALFLEYLDDSVKVPEDVERFLDRQVLMSVPEL